VAPPSPSKIDAVVVTHNNRAQIRTCVRCLLRCQNVGVTVVDNASSDGTLAEIADLRARAIPRRTNDGFAVGCNVGWRAGTAPFVLLVNPDVTIGPDAVRALASSLERSPGVAAVGPRIADARGELAFSQRRFPRLRSTFAQALLLHRVFPAAGWTDDVIRDSGAYERAGAPDWISGACVLIRRDALVGVDGLDESFFLYREDVDLCRRLRTCGYDIRFDPAATCVHEGGTSAPRSSLLPVLAESRIRYARKHSGQPAAVVERVGIALGAAVHMIVSRGGFPARAGHARSLGVALSRPVRR
jgi:GT2 family glycosyltransferase